MSRWTCIRCGIWTKWETHGVCPQCGFIEETTDEKQLIEVNGCWPIEDSTVERMEGLGYRGITMSGNRTSGYAECRKCGTTVNFSSIRNREGPLFPLRNHHANCVASNNTTLIKCNFDLCECRTWADDGGGLCLSCTHPLDFHLPEQSTQFLMNPLISEFTPPASKSYKRKPSADNPIQQKHQLAADNVDFLFADPDMAISPARYSAILRDEVQRQLYDIPEDEVNDSEPLEESLSPGLNENSGVKEENKYEFTKERPYKLQFLKGHTTPEGERGALLIGECVEQYFLNSVSRFLKAHSPLAKQPLTAGAPPEHVSTVDKLAVILLSIHHEDTSIYTPKPVLTDTWFDRDIPTPQSPGFICWGIIIFLLILYHSFLRALHSWVPHLCYFAFVFGVFIFLYCKQFFVSVYFPHVVTSYRFFLLMGCCMAGQLYFIFLTNTEDLPSTIASIVDVIGSLTLEVMIVGSDATRAPTLLQGILYALLFCYSAGYFVYVSIGEAPSQQTKLSFFDWRTNIESLSGGAHLIVAVYSFVFSVYLISFGISNHGTEGIKPLVMIRQVLCKPHTDFLGKSTTVGDLSSRDGDPLTCRLLVNSELWSETHASRFAQILNDKVGTRHLISIDYAIISKGRSHSYLATRSDSNPIFHCNKCLGVGIVMFPAAVASWLLFWALRHCIGIVTDTLLILSSGIPIVLFCYIITVRSSGRMWRSLLLTMDWVICQVAVVVYLILRALQSDKNAILTTSETLLWFATLLIASSPDAFVFSSKRLSFLAPCVWIILFIAEAIFSLYPGWSDSSETRIAMQLQLFVAVFLLTIFIRSLRSERLTVVTLPGACLKYDHLVSTVSGNYEN